MSYTDIKKYMQLTESFDDKEYENTAQGAKDFVLDETNLEEKDFLKVIADPEVDGVWLIALNKLVDEEYNAILVYLNDEDYEFIEWRDHPKKFDETTHTDEEADMNLISVAEEVIKQDISGETVTTSGDGLWSDTRKPVTLSRMEVDQVTANFGELRIYFDTTSWNVDQDGLIYTDSGFLDGVKKLLSDRGVDTENLDYSEQGMQGEDYVSFDVDAKFLQSWLNEDNEMYEDDDYEPEDYLGGQRFVGGESHETGDTVTKTVVGHRDNESKMMQRELQKIEKYAAEISSMMDRIPDGDYPHWWQAKLVKAGDYISTIKHFLEAEIENMDQPQLPTDLDPIGFDLSYDDLVAPDQESF